MTTTTTRTQTCIPLMPPSDPTFLDDLLYDDDPPTADDEALLSDRDEDEDEDELVLGAR